MVGANKPIIVDRISSDDVDQKAIIMPVMITKY